jgi:hypothetical protein
MTKYLVTYHALALPSEAAELARSREAFQRWAAENNSSLLETGAAVGAATTISREGIGKVPTDERCTGWSIIETPTVEDAIEMLKDHPYVAGGGILQIEEPVDSEGTASSHEG